MSAFRLLQPLPLLNVATGVRRQKCCSIFRRKSQCCTRLQAYKVEIEHAGGTTVLEVEEGMTVLETALDAGLELSHDCKMGVCMTCPAKLVSGQLDQSAGMLDESVKDKGYALLCVSEPKSDCKIRVIDEDEMLEEVLCSSGT